VIRRRARWGAGLCVLAALSASLALAGPSRDARPPHRVVVPVGRGASVAQPAVRRIVLGRSAAGRRIAARVLSAPGASRRVLVVGCIHGTECAGIAIARALLRAGPVAGASLWIVLDLNPDGRARGTRLNGRGVDLNRNFPAGWRPSGRRGDPEYPGPRPFSEPETKIARRLVRAIRPAITIWYHQPLALVRAWGPSVPGARRYAGRAGLPFARLPWLAGTAPQWQNRRFPGSSSFVVELPRRLGARAVARHARAVRALAAWAGPPGRPRS
jgi:murein peptide amidase A